LNFHVVEYYCRIVFKVYFWIWLTLLQIMPWYKILNCTSFSKFFLLKFSTLGKLRKYERSQVVISTLIEWLFFLGYLLKWLPAFLWMPEFELSTMQTYIPATLKILNFLNIEEEQNYVEFWPNCCIQVSWLKR
jgi:hypothetical protein